MSKRKRKSRPAPAPAPPVSETAPQPDISPATTLPRGTLAHLGPPTGHAYGIVFGVVWISAQTAARAVNRWSIQHTDPVSGEILVEVRPWFGKQSDQVSIRIALDELGLTRVDAVPLDAAGGRAEGRNTRQIRRFYRELERLLAQETR